MFMQIFFIRVLTLIQEDEDEVGIKKGIPVQVQEKDMIRTRLRKYIYLRFKLKLTYMAY